MRGEFCACGTSHGRVITPCKSEGHLAEGQAVAEGDEGGGLLGSHDACQLSCRDDVTLLQLVGRHELHAEPMFSMPLATPYS